MQRLPRHDGWQVPRAGLGGALVLHIARTWGTRRWQQAAQVAVSAVEAVNRRVHLGPPDGNERASWLQQDVSSVRTVWNGLRRRDTELLGRVVDRVTQSSRLGDRPIPETVLFLRGVVAAAVISGAVPDPDHAILDRFATWLGLAIDDSSEPEAWAGALTTIQLHSVAPDRALALANARSALDELPHSNSSDALHAALDNALQARPAARHFDSWRPCLVPAPQPVMRLVPAGVDPVSRYAVQWRAQISDALARLVASDGVAFGSAARLLQFQGGKRLRPLLALAACEACGGKPEQALDAAAQVEWLHQTSLVLDDIVDEATLRRGGPTLHTATSVPFALGTAGWLLGRLHDSQRNQNRSISKRLLAAATALAEGQRSELRHTADPELSLTGYYRIIEAKTARLFSAAATMGGECAAASPAQLQALHRFGTEAGLAFQVLDDVLDYTGDESVLGKRPGTDMLARKVTLPVLLLREALGPDDRERLASVLFDAHREPDDSDLDWLRDNIVSLGIRQECISRARVHMKRALTALEVFPQSNGKQVLSALAARFVERTQ